MQIPGTHSYSREHEWAVEHGRGVRIGITHYAQDALGDVVYIDLPRVGATVDAGEKIGEVESTKSVSEIYSPIAGTILAANDELVEAPERINSDPYGSGWICEIEPASAEWRNELLDAGGYRSLIEAS